VSLTHTRRVLPHPTSPPLPGKHLSGGTNCAWFWAHLSPGWGERCLSIPQGLLLLMVVSLFCATTPTVNPLSRTDDREEGNGMRVLHTEGPWKGAS
jgi:hypothetical protein